MLPESRSPVEIMRTMNIPPFPKPVEISDFESLTNARLSDKFSLSEQAAALVECMLYPVSEATRASFGSTLRSIPDPLRLNLKGMSRIQNRWLRATDVFHIYYDMTIGGHQARRGGATISKAVHLAAKNAKSLGTSEATSSQFARMAQLSRRLGVRLCRLKNQRIFIDEISCDHPTGQLSSMSCDFLCHVADDLEAMVVTQVTSL